MAESGGIVLKSDDGTAYFIRDEILEACKLEGEYLDAAKPILSGDEAEVEGFAMTTRATSFTAVGNFSGPPVGMKSPTLAGPQLDLGKISIESTVMCPW